uniref:Gustatory receptor n=1 Tax=Anopheles dirus TaxID=7168 RepID=A0A182NUL3_9DIPT
MEPLEQWHVLSAYVRFHQWLGFQPYRLEDGTVSPFLAQTLLQFVGVAGNLALIVYRRRCILYHCQEIGSVVDFIKLLTVILADVVLYVELYRTVQNVCSCWSALYKVHRTLDAKGMLDHRLLKRTIRWYWICLVGTFLYLLGSEGYCYLRADEMQTKRFYLYFFGLHYVLHLKEQHLVYPAIMLNLYLRMTHAALEHHVELLQHSERLGSERYLEFLAGKINSLKLLHTDLFKATTELNDAIGNSYLIIYFKNYIQIISNSYWVVFWLLNNNPDHAGRIFSRLLIRLLLLGLVFHVNTQAMDTCDRFRYRLHTIGLEIQLRSKRLFVMIESFILQTGVESIRLTAGGCFELNYKPILTVVLTVAAYISIFIQQAVYDISRVDCFIDDADC